MRLVEENAEYYFDIGSGNWIAQEPIEQVIEEIQEVVEKDVNILWSFGIKNSLQIGGMMDIIAFIP